MKASEELARKIQDDLDRMRTPITHTLSTERQKELDEIAKLLSAEQWDTLATQVSAQPDLAKSVLGADYHETDFAKRMVETVKLQKKAEAERKAKEMRDKPWTKVKIRNYMRTFVKNQGCAMYGSGWTQKKVWGLSDNQLTTQYDKLISILHSSSFNVPDVLEKHDRLMGEPTAKRIRLDDSADVSKDSTESKFPAQIIFILLQC
jgi:hypothetical protein